jgi:hypothetical protein
LEGEVIFIRLTDVGRKIDLKKVIKIIPAIPYKKVVKTKDSPSYLDFPESLNLKVTQNFNSESEIIESIKLQVKLYEDGVISLIARLVFKDIPLNNLHTLRKTIFSTADGKFNINQFLKFQFNKIYNEIREYIEEETYISITPMNEKYTLYCLTDLNMNAYDFVEENKNYLAKLLMGENPELAIHKKQIKSTLDHKFSFLENDLAIFDFDRCLIIDPNRDYEDILLVIEIANYQLLELRTLDYLLDKRLSMAEEDIRRIYFKRHSIGRRLSKKVGNLLRLRYDLTFILENIENVSKLIGDYYLAQVYKNLANLFNLKEWSDSIRHRLETTGDIYNISRTNLNERFLLYVEILLSFIFIMEFFLLLLDYLR